MCMNISHIYDPQTCQETEVNLFVEVVSSVRLYILHKVFTPRFY